MVTEIVRMAAPRLTLPARTTPEPAPRPPKAKSPLTVTGLAMVRMVPSLMSEVPAPTRRLAVPTGPLVTAPKVSVEFAASIRVPLARVKSVLKVLWPLKARTPVPVLVRLSIAAFWVIGALMVRPVWARPAATLMTGFSAENWRAVPLMVGTVTVDWLTAVTAEVSVSTSLPPTARVGLAIAPSLSKTTERRSLLPTSVRLAPPRRVTAEVFAICPALVCIVTLELSPLARPVITRSPGIMMKPGAAARLTVPPLT